MDKITPCLWFEANALEAAQFYTSVFPNSAINHVQRSPADTPGGKEGTDFLTDSSALTPVSGRTNYTFVSTSNLVADVQFWLDNTNSNFGWILISQDEATASTARRSTR